MSDYSREYYEARSAQSRAMAAAATNPQIAAIHLDLAERYDQLAQSKLDSAAAAALVAKPEAAIWRPALEAGAEA